jgi:hypothetical protein
MQFYKLKAILLNENNITNSDYLNKSDKKNENN